ncbi:AAA family ATPase [Nocardia sp. NPDC049707]|uniref:phosphatase domain-containing protein n=1 Tax=Nocardia sp. NPDC049707 TaxID=3154735 RepID=UPI00343F80DC
MSIDPIEIIEPPHRPTIYLARGYQGSGKSEECADRRRKNPLLACVSRDHLRLHLFGESGRLTFQQEEIISKAERAQAKALLDSGYDIFVDALNLRKKWAQGWADFAALNGADFEVIDFDVPVDECVRRDAARGAAGGRMVGEQVIRETARRFPRKTWPKIEPSPDLFFYPEPYVPDESLSRAWIADVDGTLAEKSPTRDIYDYTRVHEDTPIAHTVMVLQKLAADAAIIVLSGRTDDCRDETANWLRANGVPFTELHMRRTGDGRPDYKMKTEIFDEHIRYRFHVLGVFDDRLSVCRAWARMNLPLMRLGKPDHDDF